MSFHVVIRILLSCGKCEATEHLRSVQQSEEESFINNISKLICFHSYTATTSEKFVGSSGI